LRETKNVWNPCVLLDLSILNGPEKRAFRGREVGGEGLTNNVLIHVGRPRISDHVGVEGHRSAKKQYLNK